MKIVIAGAGEVGFHLAKLLSYEALDITLIDTEKDRLHYAETHLDIKTIRGNASGLSILQEADVYSSDLFIAVTSEESMNITICAIAKQLGAKRTIARISSFEYVSNQCQIDFKAMGIDDLISPENLACDEIERLLDQSAFTNSYVFEDGALNLLGTTIGQGVPFVGKSVQEAASLFSDVHFMPIAIQRRGTQFTMIPRGDTIFEAGDHAFFITDEKGGSKLINHKGKSETKIKNIPI